MEARMPVTSRHRARVGRARGLWLGVALLTAAPTAQAQSKLTCIAANEAAQDLRREGKLRDARSRLIECVAATCPGPVREDCAARLKEVEAALPTLVFVATGGSGQDLAEVRVTMDGRPFATKLDGVALPVDPGPHTFTFEAEGYAPSTKSVVVREGDKARHERVSLPSATAGAPPVAARVDPPAEAPAAEPPSPGAAGRTQRLVGLAIGGAGVVGLGVGGVFAILAKSTYDRALSSECGGQAGACSGQGQADGRSAHQQAGIATGAFAIGGALVAAGAAVYLLSPVASPVAVAPVVGTSDVGVAVRGAW